jgi:hypothetical protein
MLKRGTYRFANTPLIPWEDTEDNSDEVQLLNGQTFLRTPIVGPDVSEGASIYVTQPKHINVGFSGTHRNFAMTLYNYFRFGKSIAIRPPNLFDTDTGADDDTVETLTPDENGRYYYTNMGSFDPYSLRLYDIHGACIYEYSSSNTYNLYEIAVEPGKGRISTSTSLPFFGVIKAEYQPVFYGKIVGFSLNPLPGGLATEYNPTFTLRLKDWPVSSVTAGENTRFYLRNSATEADSPPTGTLSDTTDTGQFTWLGAKVLSPNKGTALVSTSSSYTSSEIEAIADSWISPPLHASFIPQGVAVQVGVGIASVAPNALPSPTLQSVTKYPTSGTGNWINSSGTSADNNYGFVDETPHDGDTTYVKTSAAASPCSDGYACEEFTEIPIDATIEKVVITITAAPMTYFGGTYPHRWVAPTIGYKDNNIGYTNTPTLQSVQYGHTYREYSETWETRPHDGQPWERENLDVVQDNGGFGFGMISDDYEDESAPYLMVTQIRVAVYYTIPGTVDPSAAGAKAESFVSIWRHALGRKDTLLKVYGDVVEGSDITADGAFRWSVIEGETSKSISVEENDRLLVEVWGYKPLTSSNGTVAIGWEGATETGTSNAVVVNPASFVQLAHPLYLISGN